MNIIFDTETTGLIPKGMNWETNYMQFPYLVQLAWKRSDSDRVRDFIIKPDGYEIPEESTKIHGITTEYALDHGVSLSYTFNEFFRDVFDCEKIIGHNIFFDTSIIKSNILRLLHNDHLTSVLVINKVCKLLSKEKRIDTMMKTIKFCNIKQPETKRLKFPSLVELYKKLFNESFNAHNAKDDVLATERCYNELIRLKII